MNNYQNPENCPMIDFIHLLGGKWAIPIFYRLIASTEPLRFNTLQRAMFPITQKELTKNLRTFEQRGLIKRTVYSGMPLRVEYSMTELGKSLAPVLTELGKWMVDHAHELKQGVELQQ